MNEYREGDVVLIKFTGQYCSGKRLENNEEYLAKIVYYKRNKKEFLCAENDLYIISRKKGIVCQEGACNWYITFKIDNEYVLFSADINEDYIIRKVENSIVEDFQIY